MTPYIIRFDDWSYELGVNEFEKEEKSFIPVQDGNNSGGNGCVVIVVLLTMTALAYYLISA